MLADVGRGEDDLQYRRVTSRDRGDARFTGPRDGD
jgi:hypothetical protein